mmetsp:Transcript_24096/g.4024  ORF Transcript_24096/g.4024 Transcript_24096/m.4024 type:complete len:108 (+) Transcript_24096:796-1119(+)
MHSSYLLDMYRYLGVSLAHSLEIQKINSKIVEIKETLLQSSNGPVPDATIISAIRALMTPPIHQVLQSKVYTHAFEGGRYSFAKVPPTVISPPIANPRTIKKQQSMM